MMKDELGDGGERGVIAWHVGGDLEVRDEHGDAGESGRRHPRSWLLGWTRTVRRTPRSWVEKAYPNVIYFNEGDKGGHFAAWEEPRLFSEELRAAFRPLR